MKSEELIEALAAGVKTREEHLSCYQTLLEKSEARIDRTNEMVCKLVSVVESLSKTYTAHLGSLSSCRDELVKQNSKLIEHSENLERMMRDYAASREKSEQEWRSFLRDFAQSRSAQNSIHVA